MSLIPADQHFAVIAAILFLSAIAFASERTAVGQKITGTVVVILLAIIAANVGVIPHSAPAYARLPQPLSDAEHPVKLAADTLEPQFAKAVFFRANLSLQMVSHCVALVVVRCLR